MSAPPSLPTAAVWSDLLDTALREDIGTGDVTSQLTIPADQLATAQIEARSDLVYCGWEVAREVFIRVDSSLECHCVPREGERVSGGSVLAKIHGNLRSILAAERTALNFLGRLCGVATHTRRFVDAIAGTSAKIVDTRKTIPGWRELDKYATAMGGAINHRIGLFDAILLKDNHIAAIGDVAAAVKTARERAPKHLWLQAEVESQADAVAAAEAGADSILLDNLPPDAMREIAQRLGARLVIEASGGIDLDNVRAVAETGVHRISIGALTHSAPVADVALEICDGGVAA